MLKDNDADIDALLGSVVGGNGEPASFPAMATAGLITPIRRTNKRNKLAIVRELSAELAAQIELNEAVRKFVDPISVPVRFSRLRTMAASALHYWQSVQEDRDDTISMRFGRGVHALSLGTPVKRWTGKNRNSKDYKAFVAENPGTEVLTTKEWDRAHGIFEAITRHPIANALIFAPGTVREETIEFEINGRKCTARPDARFGTDVCVDLKTTKCAEPRKFERDAMWRGYHAQFSFYGRGIRERFGSFPKESLCVAVESVKPFPITVLQLTPGALEQGEKCWRLWWERLMACESANYWPAYTEVIEKLDVASNDDVQLIIEGEEFSYDEE